MGAVDVFLRALALDAVLIDAIGQSAHAPPLPLGKGGSRQFYNTKFTNQVSLRYSV